MSIKCEVVVDGDLIFCNGRLIEVVIHENYEKSYVTSTEYFSSLEQAIKYCMEQSK